MIQTKKPYIAQNRRYSNADFDWNAAVSDTTTMLGSIFGTSDKYTAKAYSTMYKQEQRTNTILWVVIGLMVALGVVLLVRKH